jgi:hypothetical protein
MPRKLLLQAIDRSRRAERRPVVQRSVDAQDNFFVRHAARYFARDLFVREGMHRSRPQSRFRGQSHNSHHPLYMMHAIKSTEEFAHMIDRGERCIMTTGACCLYDHPCVRSSRARRCRRVLSLRSFLCLFVCLLIVLMTCLRRTIRVLVVKETHRCDGHPHLRFRHFG